MGLRTQLSLQWDDADRAQGSLEVDHVIEAARAFVNRHSWSDDVLLDLRAACASEALGEPGFNAVLSHGVIELIRAVSAQIPDVTFYAKGAGEAVWDIWARQFRDGVEAFAHGPFDEDARPIPEDLLAQAKAAFAAEAERKAQLEATQRKPGWVAKLFR